MTQTSIFVTFRKKPDGCWDQPLTCGVDAWFEEANIPQIRLHAENHYSEDEGLVCGVTYEYFFNDPNQALLFKLTWGGQ